MRGSTEPPCHVELVETSRWRVLLAIGEVHLLAQFGLYFRDEFRELASSSSVQQVSLFYVT